MFPKKFMYDRSLGASFDNSFAVGDPSQTQTPALTLIIRTSKLECESTTAVTLKSYRSMCLVA
jgi:hypothetical protein